MKTTVYRQINTLFDVCIVQIYQFQTLITGLTYIKEPAPVAAGEGILGYIPTYDQPARTPETVIDLLLQLDCFMCPGITLDKFKRLFRKCCCGLVMTHRAFKHHTCLQTRTIIDLTVDGVANDSQ
jgi:hypothetical protein